MKEEDEEKLDDAINYGNTVDSKHEDCGPNVEQIELHGTSIVAKNDNDESVSSSCESGSESNVP